MTVERSKQLTRRETIGYLSAFTAGVACAPGCGSKATPAPKARDYGWRLKKIETSFFEVGESLGGQKFCVLNHAPLRGINCRMIHWWFKHFSRMKVRLKNVPGYDGKEVPAYWLWHPIDHISADLVAAPTQKTWEVGTKIHIQECMQYDVYGDKYRVDDEAMLWLLEDGHMGGQGMGKRLPFGSNWAAKTRISWADLPEGGVHYHYEIVVGLAEPGFLGRILNDKIAGKFSKEFLAAWQRHNVIEVGTFENFLPALYAQRENLPNTLIYDAASMNDGAKHPAEQAPADSSFAKKRVESLKGRKDAMKDLDLAFGG